MITPQRLSADIRPRLAALQECEHKIQSAYRRGLEATCEIVKELETIAKEELYEECGYQTFADYCKNRLKIHPNTLRRMTDVSQTVELLLAAQLELPSNETQVAELASLEPEKRAPAWKKFLAERDPEVAMTAAEVRRAIDKARPVTPVPPTPPATPAQGGGGIEVDMDNGDQPPQPPTPVTGVVIPVYTEKGEAALARIRKLCGEAVAQAIESGTRQIPERDLRTWAEQPDYLVKLIPNYVIHQTWRVGKAIAFETTPIHGDMTADDMILMAKARDNTATLNYQNAKITIVINP